MSRSLRWILLSIYNNLLTKDVEQVRYTSDFTGQLYNVAQVILVFAFLDSHTNISQVRIDLIGECRKRLNAAYCCNKAAAYFVSLVSASVCVY